jgi:hypothetical protein
MEVLMQVKHNHGKNRVIRKPLKNLGDVRNPERPFKAGFNLLQTLGK